MKEKNNSSITTTFPFPLPLPLIIQIRISCWQGLFKGCLLVTTDTKLCPEGKITMRQSMRKTNGSLRFHESNTLEGIIIREEEGLSTTTAVRTTVPMCITNFYYSPQMNGECKSKSYVTRQILMLLHGLGLKKDFILQRFSQYGESLAAAIDNRGDAIRLINRYKYGDSGRKKAMAGSLLDYDEDYDEDEDESDKDDTDINNTTTTTTSGTATTTSGTATTTSGTATTTTDNNQDNSSRKQRSVAEKHAEEADGFICAGHSLKDPR